MPSLRQPLAVEGGVAIVGSSSSGDENIDAKDTSQGECGDIVDFRRLGYSDGIPEKKKEEKIDDKGCQARSTKIQQSTKSFPHNDGVAIIATGNENDSSSFPVSISGLDVISSSAVFPSSLEKANDSQNADNKIQCDFDASTKCRKLKQTPGERLKRSRERNRMHARKTRQRKKEHMQNLQNRADDLKKEQIRLRQTINEKNTASILAGMFSIDKQKPLVAEDPQIEILLQRSIEDIPDSSKIPELPALILPGAHTAKKVNGQIIQIPETSGDENKQLPDDGIDYQLLGKDRSKCTPAELDKIRRERNRMHAKRTRDRKRIFMEEMEELIKTLESENDLLGDHLRSMGVDPESPALVSPNLSPTSPKKDSEPPENLLDDRLLKEQKVSHSGGQLKSLLDAVGSMSQGIAAPTAVVSSNSSCEDTFSHDGRSPKRRKRDEAVPSSITTTAGAAQATTESPGCQ